MKINVNQLATDTEIFFNITNSIPVLAVPGSLCRAAAAQTQFVAGGVFAAVGFIGQMVQPENKEWKYTFENSCDHMIHAVLNELRAVGELTLSLTLVGSLIPFMYQLASENRFQPIIKYDTADFKESKYPQGVYA